MQAPYAVLFVKSNVRIIQINLNNIAYKLIGCQNDWPNALQLFEIPTSSRIEIGDGYSFIDPIQLLGRLFVCIM